MSSFLIHITSYFLVYIIIAILFMAQNTFSFTEIFQSFKLLVLCIICLSLSSLYVIHLKFFTPEATKRSFSHLFLLIIPYFCRSPISLSISRTNFWPKNVKCIDPFQRGRFQSRGTKGYLTKTWRKYNYDWFLGNSEV